MRLTVRDADDRSSRAGTDLRAAPGETDSGSGTRDPMEGIELNVDFGTILFPIAIAILVGILHVVLFLVGGSITKAGWNLIRPRPETVQVRVKPRDLQVEPVGAAPMGQPAPPAPAAEPAPPGVPPAPED